jgi:hypothetical protein
MYLWAEHVISPSWSGLLNLPYHLRRVSQFDAPALPFFIPGLLARAVNVAGKAIGRLRPARAA